MQALAIWELEGENLTKMIHSKADMKNAKYNGRKPDKLVLGPNGIFRMKNSELKKYVSHTGLIVQANADKPIYDGRKKNL